MKLSQVRSNLWRVLPQTRRGQLCGLGAVFVLVLLLGLLNSGTAGAQDRELQAQSDAAYTFGQHMWFSLRAKSDDELRGVTLFFNTPEMESTYTVDLEVESARDIDIQHEIALTQVQLAPFTTVRYWWRLATERDTWLVEEKTIDYVDDRFQWHELARDGAVIRWTGDDASLGETAHDVVARARPRLNSVLAAELAPLDVYIYPSMADLRSALRLTGRDWIGAEAMPELGVILVTAVNPRTAALDLGQDIPHELSHLALYRMMGSRYEAAPRWLDEGLAVMFEMSPDIGREALLDQAVANGETIPFTALCRAFPSGEEQVRLAYAQSASLVVYIRQEYGTSALQDLVQAFIDGADCDSGVEDVIGLSTAELEREWLAQATPVSPLERFLRANGVWVVLAGGGFLVMGLLMFPLRRER